MKIFILILPCILSSLVNSEYPRFKRRGFVGQPGPPRSQQPPPQFHKKWPAQSQFLQKPQRRPMVIQKKPFHYQKIKPQMIQKVQSFQNTPANFKMPNAIKKPTLVHPQPHRPMAASPPAHFVWQNQIQEQNLKFPIDNGSGLIPKFNPEKAPFKSSPTLPVPIDYDFHIQTNSIPTNAAPIQQYGEKGPIHTIPAPDLSLADKPGDLRLNKPIVPARHEFSYPETEKNPHQYQVTESSEHMPKPYFRDQITLNAEAGQAYQNIQDFYNHENQKSLQQSVIFEDNTQSQAPQQGNTHDSGTGQLYTQAIQSTFTQQHPQFNTIQFVQDEAIYGQRSAVEDLEAESSDNIDIQVHPANNHFERKEGTTNAGFVTATYTLSDSDDRSEIKIGSKSNVDSVIQSHIVNSYFDTRTESNEVNNVEPDAKPSLDTEKQEKLILSYYSSLPNKEAVERLVKLQKAGKINSSLMQMSTQTGSSPISIYVPDDDTKGDEETMIMTESGQNSRETEYEEDYLHEEQDVSPEEPPNFGNKIKSRRNLKKN